MARGSPSERSIGFAPGSIPARSSARRLKGEANDGVERRGGSVGRHVWVLAHDPEKWEPDFRDEASAPSTSRSERRKFRQRAGAFRFGASIKGGRPSSDAILVPLGVRASSYGTTSPCRLVSRPSTSTAWLTLTPMRMFTTMRMTSVPNPDQTRVTSTPSI